MKMEGKVMALEVVFEDDTPRTNDEALLKEYRSDVVVCVDGKRYKVYVTTMCRLQQDFETEVEHKGYFQSEPNMILVRNTTKEEIVRTITKMYDCKYFEALDNYGFDEAVAQTDVER